MITRYFYGKNGDGIAVNHLAARAYLDYKYDQYNRWQDFNNGVIFLDETCYKDYATLLLPRAEGYAFSLMQYFFRGQIEALNADTIKDSNENVTGMVLKVKNNTSGEQMFKNYSSHLVVSYSYTEGGQKHYGKSEDILLREDIPPNNSTSDNTYLYTFSFSSPIPADATEKEYLLVYRGKLGDENNAVAARKVDLPPYSILFDLKGNGYDLYFDTGSCDPGDSWSISEGNIFPTILGGKSITRIRVPLALNDYFNKETYKTFGELGNYRVYAEVWKFNPQYVVYSGSSDKFDDLYIYDTVIGIASGDIVIGSDGNDYRCIKAHQSSSNNRPITGSSWATYWVSNGTTGRGTAWISGNSYSEGIRYRCIKSHTATPDTEPGVGANWCTYWEATSRIPYTNYDTLQCKLYNMVWQNGATYKGDLYGKSNEISYVSLVDSLSFSGYTKTDFSFSSPAIIPVDTSVYVFVRFSWASYLGVVDPLFGCSWISLFMDGIQRSYPNTDAMEAWICYEPSDVVNASCDRSYPYSEYKNKVSAAMTIYGY